MEGPTVPALSPPLNTVEPLRRTTFNRIFAAVYASAILALLYRHSKLLLLHSKIPLSFSISLSLFIADIVLAFMWTTTQAMRMCPVRRKQFPENLKKMVKERDFPGLDIFICTADPYKEPPMGVVNTALSLMAYDYPAEKISVYVSDDGGSALTLFAFMEAAKFATHWLPFCRKNNITERSPDEYFSLKNYQCRFSETAQKIKIMYENMKMKVEDVVEKGKIDYEYIKDDQERKAFDIWTDKFSRQDHPTVIKVLLDNSKDRDISGNLMPNLIYVSRQKSKTSPHHFKAGALNVLLRVSAVMSNAPIIQTQDCDMYSNDPQTPLRVLCYVCDPAIRSKLGYVQFPQHFHGLNKNDIYASEYKRMYQINSMGLDGLMGPNYVGPGCFFVRRAFFGGPAPSAMLPPEIPQLGPDYVVDKPITSEAVLALAHKVAGCNYENQTQWGSETGFRYGSTSEDLFTGYRLKCEGWKGVLCKPQRAAFLGDVPITLLDLLTQCKRWSIGQYQVGFCKHSPLTFGIRSMGLLMGLGYSYYSFWGIWSIPVTFYAFLPQLALLNGVCIFPEISKPWFFLYVFLFLGAYGQDLLEFVLAGASVGRWWNDQRMWLIKGLSCFLFATIEYLLKSFGFSTHGFTVTSKVVDDEHSKRYEQGIFEFGVTSPMFVPITMAAIINLFSFIWGMIQVSSSSNKTDGLCLQTLLSGFVVMNSWPIYEAIGFRKDRGKMPNKVTITAMFLVGVVYIAASLILK
ncbi:hypothetical protein SLA2020_232090 [Shorea laevis]